MTERTHASRPSRVKERRAKDESRRHSCSPKIDVVGVQRYKCGKVTVADGISEGHTPEQQRGRRCEPRGDGESEADVGRRSSRSGKGSDSSGERPHRTPSKRPNRRRRISPSSEHDSEDDENVVNSYRPGRHRIKPHTFDGQGSFETFWAHFDNCPIYNKWNDRDKVAHLRASLTGAAGQVLWDTGEDVINSLDKLTALLRARFSGSRQADKFRMELRARRRRPGETVAALHHDIRRLMALAYPNVASNARESIACDYFVDALDDADFALKVRERAPASLDDALRIALQLEAWLNLASKVREGETPQSKVRMRAAAGTEGDVPPAVNKRLDRLEMEMRKQFSDIKQSMGNRTATVTATAAPQENAAGEAESKVPRSFGERAAMPPWAGKPRSPTSNRNTSAVCWRCGEAGHIRRNCPLPHTDVKAEVNKEANLSRPSSRVSKGLDQTCVYVKMYLKGKELPCLLDSGSETTLIPQSVFNEV